MRLRAAVLLLAAVALPVTGLPAAAQDRVRVGGEPGQGNSPARSAGSERPTVMVEPAGMFVAACDADGDGHTTRAELAACVERSFRAIDTGGSGRLGYIAFADWAERFLGSRTALPSPFAVDKDGDNQITPAELGAAMAHEFDRFDANHDGAVTRAELLTIREVPGGERPGGPGGGRGRGGRGRGGPPGG